MHGTEGHKWPNGHGKKVMTNYQKVGWHGRGHTMNPVGWNPHDGYFLIIPFQAT